MYAVVHGGTDEALRQACDSILTLTLPSPYP